MRHKDTGEVHLIEMNPRATQMMHLALGPGRDLCHALVTAAGGVAPQRKPDTASDVIALFPQEWTRDPGSPYLRTAYHDIPAHNPLLLRACAPPSFRRTPQAR